MNEKKIRAVISLPAPERYSHFIKVAADRRLVWGLWSDGWGLHQTDDDGTTVFPIWPEKVYAELCATDEWSHFEASEIDLDDLLEELIPRLRKDGKLVTVFPVPGIGGIVPALDVFEEDLRKELSRIE